MRYYLLGTFYLTLSVAPVLFVAYSIMQSEKSSISAHENLFLLAMCLLMHIPLVMLAGHFYKVDPELTSNWCKVVFWVFLLMVLLSSISMIAVG